MHFYREGKMHGKGWPMAFVLATGVALALPAAAGKGEKILGQDKIFAFCYVGYDPKKLRSATLIFADPAEWKHWQKRGVTPAVGQTWFALLNPHSRENGKPIWSLEKAVEVLVDRDYGGSPSPVVCIDEFGFDFGGETDQKIAEVLEETKRRKPDLGIAIWQMRGPISKVLADAYRKFADLVMMECYVGDKRNYWWIATQVYAARMHGLIEKSIVYLGLGQEWARTKEELERQIRFVRLIAPESPGIGFFGPDAPSELIEYADELCSRWDQIPTDGSGLPGELIELHKVFAGRHKRPTIVCSPLWVEPDRSRADPNLLVEPKTMRVYLLNMGESEAKDVRVRLRNPKEAGGDVFAEGMVGVIPKRGETIAVLPVVGQWKVWKTWELDVEAEGCEVLKFAFAK
jgi:hypothetical protein